MNFGDSAERLRRNSYAPAPILAGNSRPLGPWGIVQLEYSPAQHASDGVAVLCTLPAPRGETGRADHQATWLAAVELNVPHAKALTAMAAVIPKTALVRVAADDSRLYLFALNGVSFSTMRREYEGVGRVDVIAGAEFVAVSGYDWENGSPLDTPRSSLPVLTVDAAHALLAAIDVATEPFIPLPAGVMNG